MHRVIFELGVGVGRGNSQATFEQLMGGGKGPLPPDFLGRKGTLLKNVLFGFALFDQQQCATNVVWTFPIVLRFRPYGKCSLYYFYYNQIFFLYLFSKLPLSLNFLFFFFVFYLIASISTFITISIQCLPRQPQRPTAATALNGLISLLQFYS